MVQQSSSNALDVIVPSVFNLVMFTVWTRTELCTLPALKIKPGETLADLAFQSKLHNIIQYIHNDNIIQYIHNETLFLKQSEDASGHIQLPGIPPDATTMEIIEAILLKAEDLYDKLCTAGLWNKTKGGGEVLNALVSLVHACWNCGYEEHHVGDCPKAHNKKLLPRIGRLSMMPSIVLIVAVVAKTKMEPNLVAQAVEMVDAVVVAKDNNIQSIAAGLA
eukprot:scaffold70957_cov117-Cyclotella_meneghiniana.AAC.2